MGEMQLGVTQNTLPDIINYRSIAFSLIASILLHLKITHNLIEGSDGVLNFSNICNAMEH